MIKILGDKESLWQWDIGQKVVVEDDDTITQVHFSNDGVQTYTSDVYEFEGQNVADIPDILLQQAKTIKVYSYDVNGVMCTDEMIKFKVKARPMPPDYVYELASSQLRFYTRNESDEKFAKKEDIEKNYFPYRIIELEMNLDLPSEFDGEKIKYICNQLLSIEKDYSYHYDGMLIIKNTGENESSVNFKYRVPGDLETFSENLSALYLIYIYKPRNIVTLYNLATSNMFTIQKNDDGSYDAYYENSVEAYLQEKIDDKLDKDLGYENRNKLLSTDNYGKVEVSDFSLAKEKILEFNFNISGIHEKEIYLPDGFYADNTMIEEIMFSTQSGMYGDIWECAKGIAYDIDQDDAYNEYPQFRIEMYRKVPYNFLKLTVFRYVIEKDWDDTKHLKISKRTDSKNMKVRVKIRTIDSNEKETFY